MTASINSLHAGDTHNDDEAAKIRAKLAAIPLTEKVTLTEEEWKKVLPPEDYKVLREQATECPFQNKFWDNHDRGVFACAACGNPLFSSDHKFNSGTGWPSFYQALIKDAVTTKRDTSHGMVRVEVLCARCGSHLGHLFEDGPAPTRQRFCINSQALKLVK